MNRKFIYHKIYENVKKGGISIRKVVAITVMLLFIIVSIIPSTGIELVEKSTVPIYFNNHDNYYYRYSDFNYDNKGLSTSKQTEDVHFYGQSNKSIYLCLTGGDPCHLWTGPVCT